MRETWRRRRGNALTLAGFQAAGGFEGALAQTAEDFHSGLSGTQQRIARQLFLRLIALGEGTEDTKRRVPRHELDDTADVAHVLEQATRARLLTVDRDRVEITHEALIGCWPRLGRWLSEDREHLRLHRALTEATAVWESLDHHPDTLYRGVRLAAVRDLPEDVLTARERAFLDASRSAEESEARRVRRHLRRLRGSSRLSSHCSSARPRPSRSPCTSSRSPRRSATRPSPSRPSTPRPICGSATSRSPPSWR
ncbi:hypothetical protein ACFQ3Z_07580 [Streptomyces nogalater]